MNEESEDAANGPGQGRGHQHDPARADLRGRRRRGPGVRRPERAAPRQERRLSALGRRRTRLAAGQALDHRGADLGVGVDPDDDPADRADDAVDGAVRGRSRRRWETSTPLPHPGRFHASLMGAVSLIWTLFIINVSQNVLGDSITGARLPDRLLLRPDRVRVRDLSTARSCSRARRTSSWSAWSRSPGSLMLTFIFVKAFIDNEPARLGVLRRIPGYRLGRTRWRRAIRAWLGPPDGVELSC